MKRIWCLLLFLLLTTGCASKNSADVNKGSYFITESVDSIADGGYVIVKEHSLDAVTVSQTLCPGIQGVSSVRAHNPGEVIVDYDDGNQKTFSFGDEVLDIEYITKTQDSYTPCVIRSANCVYVYSADVADFSMIADDFLFYLENYQDKYYYVNTQHELVDQDGNVYCTDVVGVRADSNRNNTVVYVANK